MVAKQFSRLFMLLLLVGFVSGCDELTKIEDTDDTDYLASLVGSWEATANTMTNNANTSQSDDLYAEGARVTLAITATGGLTATFSHPVGGVEVENGTIVVEKTTLTVSIPDNPPPMTFNWVLVGDVLTLVNTNEYHDFGSGEVPATLTVVLQRVTGTVDLEALAGDWSATQFRFTNLANPAQQADIVALGGFLTMKITAAGALTMMMGAPDDEQGPGLESGTIAVVGDSLVITMPSEPQPMKMGYSLTGGILSISQSPNNFDFGTGTDVPCRLDIILAPITEPALNALDGTWELESAILSNPFNPGQQADETASIAAMAAVLSGGEIEVAMLSWDDEGDIMAGSYTFFGNLILMDLGQVEGPEVMLVWTEGGKMHLRSIYESYDWTETDVWEPAIATYVFKPFTGPGLAQLAGTWKAIAVTQTNPANPEQVVDEMADGGAMTMQVEAGGAMRLVMALPSMEEVEEGFGTIRTIGPVLVISGGLAEVPAGMILEEVTGGIRITNPYDSYNWDQSEYWGPSIFRLTMVPVTSPAAPADFVGNWDATVMKFWSLPGLTTTIDMIAAGGSLSLAITGEMALSGTMTPPGQSPETITGSVEVFGNLLLIYTTGEFPELKALEYTFESASAVVLWSYVESADFDEDGVEDEPAFMELRLVAPTLLHH